MKVTSAKEHVIEDIEDRISAMRLPCDGGITWMIDINVGDKTVRATSVEWNQILDLALDGYRARMA